MTMATLTTSPNNIEIRSHINITPNHGRFEASSKHQANLYDSQYSTLYSRRLRDTRPLFVEKLNNNDIPYIHRIIECKEDTLCVVLGTVVVVRGDENHEKENQENNGFSTTTNFMHASKKNDNGKANTKTTFMLVLEDDSGRVALNFNDYFNSNAGSHDKKEKFHLTTGVVIGVQGKIPVNTGVMNVEEIYFAGPDYHYKDDNDLLSNISVNNDNEEDGDYIMFVSGLECGSKLHSSNDSLKRKLLVYFFWATTTLSCT